MTEPASHPDRSAGRLLVKAALVLVVGLTAALLGSGPVPLGVQGEWVWNRVDLDSGALARVILCGLAGAIYVAIALLGRKRLGVAGAVERAGWLTVLVCVSFGWLWVVLDSIAPTPGHARTIWVLYAPRSSGYFWHARYEVDDTAEFLVGYEDLLSEQDYLHIGTHPPGLTLGYRGLLHICQISPALTRAVLSSMPSDIRETVLVIREQPLAEKPFLESDAACLWLAVLLTQMAVALTTTGIYGLAVRHHDRRTAWMAACLWPLIPAVGVFFPKSDVLYALLSVTAAWLWLTAFDRQSSTRAVLAGITLWLGMMLSLAFVTVIALIGMMAFWERRTTQSQVTADEPHFQNAKVIAGTAIGFLVPMAVFGFLADIRLLNVWLWNLSNHALFYEHNVRTYWKWLLVNPVETACAVGLPIAVVALYGMGSQFRSGAWRSPSASCAIGFAVIWTLLLVSGKNMGEAARLWILIMPWSVLAAAPGLACLTQDSSRPGRDVGVWLILAQLVVAIMTILRVDGFHFADLLAALNVP